MKKAMMLLIALILVLPMTYAFFELSDNFNDNDIDALVWVNKSHSATGNYALNETNYRIEIYGNNTTGASDYVYIQSLAKINASENGRASIDYKANSSWDSNSHTVFGITNHVNGNSWVSAPPTYCGATFEVFNNKLRILENYPVASLVKDVSALDTGWHELLIVVSRGSGTTTYNMYVDGVLESAVTQSSLCGNPTVNVSVASWSTSSATFESIYFDNFNMLGTLGYNTTGAGCNDDSDCASGKCEAGFCVLKRGNELCTDDTQCLSGICTNGKCADADMWTNVEDSKNSFFGDSPMSNNFISMVFIVGVPTIIIASAPGLPAVLLGGMLSIGLTFFFTLVGWLSPFILGGILFGGMVIGALVWISKS